MVRARDALATILALLLVLAAWIGILYTPTNVLFLTLPPAVLLPVAYVVDRRRRAGRVGLQYGERDMLLAGLASAFAWLLVPFVFPVAEMAVVASAISAFTVVLVVRGWQRVARTP